VQVGNCYGQAESSRARTAWIHELHAVTFGDHGLVRVSGHDDSEACGSRVHLYFLHVVENVDADAFQLQREMKRDRGRPRAFVVVSPDCIHWRNRAQLFQDFGSAYVACMDDVVDPGQCTDCFRPKQSVRIRDDAYRFQRLLLVPRSQRP
jgi:hypothetical protein